MVERLDETFFGLAKRNAILWALRAGDARANGVEIEFSSSISVNRGSCVVAVRYMPWALQYASTSATRSSGRPVARRKLIVRASTGKNPQVAPYSGAILLMVARSATDNSSSQAPEEFDELAYHHPELTQHLGDGQRQISRRDPFPEPAKDL